MPLPASEPDGAAGAPRRAVDPGGEPPTGEPPAGLGRPGAGFPDFLPPRAPWEANRPAAASGAPGRGPWPGATPGTPYGAAGLSSDWLPQEPTAPASDGYPGPYAPPRGPQPSSPSRPPTVGVGTVLGFVVGAVVLVLVAAYLAWPRPAEQPPGPSPAPSSAAGPSPPPSGRRTPAATPRGSVSPAGPRLQLGDIPAQVGGWQAEELTPGILLYVKGRVSLTVIRLEGTNAESYMRVLTDAPAISSDGRVWCGVATKMPGMGDGTWCAIQTQRLGLISIADPDASVPGSDVTMLADAIAQQNP